MKNKWLPLIDSILILCIVVFAVMFCLMYSKVQKADRESKIKKEIKAELIRQATDDGADGDEYVVFLFPATKAYTEVSEAGGRYYLSYIIGSGTDDEGEWQLVKYEPGGNIRFYDIP
ncbi:MAG: hypothetical protein J5958_06635 [Clostridia bacterium]|nr:hypothetical protein [Clostridia bacterium]